MRARIKHSSVNLNGRGTDTIVGDGQAVTVPEGDPAPPRTTLSDGTQIYPEHRTLRPSGQQNGWPKPANCSSRKPSRHLKRLPPILTTGCERSQTSKLRLPTKRPSRKTR